MNSTLQILTPTIENQEPAPATTPASESQAENSGPSGTPHSDHRGRGKIACLPKKVRDHLNQMLEDGVRYAQIKENLGEHGTDLTPDNISQWKKRGHQAWLKEQFWREEMRARMDAFTDLLGDTDPAQLPMVGLQMSLTQLCEQLRDIGPGARKDQFEADADKYLRMLNTLSRLSKSFLALQKFQRDSAAAAAVELKRLDPNRKINAAEETAMQDKSDDFFGWKSADRIRREMAIASQVRTDSTPSLKVIPTPAAPAPASPSPAAAAGLPVSPLPPAGDLGKKATHSNSEFKVESSTLDVQSSGSVPLTGSLPVRLGPQPPAAPPPVTRHPSPSTERCHECRCLLPPLLPSGERPSTHCNKCGAGLRAPGALIEYCPKCRHVLPELKSDGTRPIPNCQNCNKPLPPPPS